MDFSIAIIEGNVKINDSAELWIHTNRTLSYRFPVHQLTKVFRVPQSCKVKMQLVNTSSNKQYGQVSFSSSILPKVGAFWLPLLNGPTDFIKSLPYNGLSQLWMQISPNILTPIYEASEKSESVVSLDEDTEDAPKSLVKRIKFLENQIEDMFLHSEELNKTLVKTVSEKDNLAEELKFAYQEIETRAERQKTLEKEIKQLRSELNSNKKTKSEFLKTFQGPLRAYKINSNTDSKDTQDFSKFLNGISKEHKNGKETISAKENENSKEFAGDSSLKDLQSIFKDFQGLLKAPVDLDPQVKLKLREIGKPGLFKRIDENTYTIGRKIVTVDIKGKQLIWNVDGKNVSFEDLINIANTVKRSSSSQRGKIKKAVLNRTFGGNSSGDIKVGLLTPYRERKMSHKS